VPDSEELVPEVVGAPHRPHRWRRVVGWLVLAAVLAPVVWYGVALFQVWRTARTDRARPAQAIIVLGAAQYDGRPSPVLESRLRHALALWQDGIAPAIVVTGGRQPGDRFTEATASAQWLLDRGVPDDAILREVQGASTWESLAASARFLRARGIDDVVIVSDPYHLLRAEETAEELGLRATTSPVPDSLVTGWSEKRRMLKEAAGVSVARLPFVGYRRLLQLTG
jgi:uncharacterized SAM-binding protein YcdF (DUF218 family)